MMTKQEIFNVVVPHLLTQGGRSQIPDGTICAYRGEGGRKCAVGCLIPDELYDPIFEVRNIFDKKVQEALVKAGVLPVAGGSHSQIFFLAELQKTHDAVEPEYWMHSLMTVAERNELELPPMLAEKLRT